MGKPEIPERIKFTEKRDGLELMLLASSNFGQLPSVSRNTGVPIETLRGFINGTVKLTPEQDRILRGPLKEFGGEVTVSVDLKKVKAGNSRGE